jgi:hypothetical protein
MIEEAKLEEVQANVARLHQLLAEMVDIVREIDEVVAASQIKPR